MAIFLQYTMTFFLFSLCVHFLIDFICGGQAGRETPQDGRYAKMAEVPVTTSTWDANGPMTC